MSLGIHRYTSVPNFIQIGPRLWPLGRWPILLDRQTDVRQTDRRQTNILLQFLSPRGSKRAEKKSFSSTGSKRFFETVVIHVLRDSGHIIKIIRSIIYGRKDWTWVRYVKIILRMNEKQSKLTNIIVILTRKVLSGADRIKHEPRLALILSTF